jgi:hypothetical protein
VVELDAVKVGYMSRSKTSNVPQRNCLREEINAHSRETYGPLHNEGRASGSKRRKGGAVAGGVGAVLSPMESVTAAAAVKGQRRRRLWNLQ